jgi:hypothetical protein
MCSESDGLVRDGRDVETPAGPQALHKPAFVQVGGGCVHGLTSVDAVRHLEPIDELPARRASSRVKGSLGGRGGRARGPCADARRC